MQEGMRKSQTGHRGSAEDFSTGVVLGMGLQE